MVGPTKWNGVPKEIRSISNFKLFTKNCIHVLIK